MSKQIKAIRAEDWSKYLASQHQRDPKPGETKVIDLVMADLQARAEVGRERYGAYLETGNGRDALMDAYQEALDLCMYLRQEIEERRERTALD